MMEFVGQEAHLVASDWFETKGQALVAEALRKAPWAHAVGEDGFGVYADLRVGAAKQRLRYIMPGEFLMGSPDDEEGRYPGEEQHSVTIAKGFWMANTPCTQKFWSWVQGVLHIHFNNPNNPVECVSWHDAQEFCTKLGRFAPELNARLPSEAQWEYACRAGTAGPRYGELDDIAWWKGNSGGHTHPVGLLKPNPWGLYDMLGNVWECATNRYSMWMCGGSYGADKEDLRSSRHWWSDMDVRLKFIGFRFIIG